MELYTRDLDHSEVTPLLDQLSRDYARLTGKGGMRGILVVDQDAKVIARNSMFQLKKPWDMGGIAAALHGVAKQASAYFNCASLERVAINFGDMQFFVHAIGSVEVEEGNGRRELLLVILADENVKMGLVLIQMRKIGPEIIQAIKESRKTIDLLNLDERSVKKYLLALKQHT